MSAPIKRPRESELHLQARKNFKKPIYSSYFGKKFHQGSVSEDQGECRTPLVVEEEPVTVDNANHTKLRSDLARALDSAVSKDNGERADSSDDDDSEVTFDDFCAEELATEPKNSGSAVFVKWMCLFLTSLQIRFNLPDTAVQALVSFLNIFFKVLARVTKSSYLSELASALPASLYALWKYLDVSKDNFTRFVVCPKCFCLYKRDECVTTVEGQSVSKSCSHVPYPNHTQAARSNACGELLMKKVECDGVVSFYPFKVYCYKPVQESMKRLLLRSGFEEKCELWRERDSIPGESLTDVYDGAIWKLFQTEEKGSFLNSPHRYGLMLNLDWFQPFKHVNYSVGVLYAVVLNLPRSERFSLQNVLIIGILPNFRREPPVNTFVEPLVNELTAVWSEGVQCSTYGSPQEPVSIRYALMCVGCDVPATRKLCGFLGHAATVGCSKCNKKFPGGVGQKDYSGFDRDAWPSKEIDKVKADMERYQSGKTPTAKEQIASEVGVRFSCLINLPYFDVVRMSVIDPMHNVFLGTAKHMIHVWVQKGHLPEKKFAELQEKSDRLQVPKSMGRLPRKIASSFGGFTAEQWKNWTNFFSLFALKDVLREDLVNHWTLFVKASRLLCQRNLTLADVDKLDTYLLDFCTGFEALYGRDLVTPNMHLHGHLTSCLKDYGPVYSFWLFSFERYNGHLGSLPNNNKAVEIQFMRRFQRDADVCALQCPTEFASDLSIHVPTLNNSDNLDSESPLQPNVALKMSRFSDPCVDLHTLDWTNLTGFTAQHPLREILGTAETNLLRKMYKRLYKDSQVIDTSSMKVSSAVFQCTSVRVGDTLLGSVKSRHKRSAFVCANWNRDGGKIVHSLSDPRSASTKKMSPGVIQYFVIHQLEVGGRYLQHLLVRLNWYTHTARDAAAFCPEPLEIWDACLFDVTGESSFMPIQRAERTFLWSESKIREKKVMFVCPGDRLI